MDISVPIAKFVNIMKKPIVIQHQLSQKGMWLHMIQNYTGSKICYNITCPLDIPQLTSGCMCWETCPYYNSGPTITTTSTGTGSYTYREGSTTAWPVNFYSSTGTSSQTDQEH